VADIRFMRASPGPVLRAPWSTAALAALLAVLTPATAWIVGERAAIAAPRTVVIAGIAGVAPSPIAPTDLTAPVPGPEPEAKASTKPEPHLLVRAKPGLVARRNPWAGAPVVATVAHVSKYYHQPLVLWVEEVSLNGEWGLVELPYVWPRREGWIHLDGLERSTTWITVRVDLSDHMVRVYKRDELLLKMAGATGAASSPTPPGDYVVSDHVTFPGGGSLGTYAFGISGIQPRLPAGWTGGNQLAIHGTNAPWSIGKSASAGCIRVAEWALDALKPLLRQGTPVLIRP
jgi:lipoprotein-anchoring transpeptidase ErfK/SrfK